MSERPRGPLTPEGGSKDLTAADGRGPAGADLVAPPGERASDAPPTLLEAAPPEAPAALASAAPPPAHSSVPSGVGQVPLVDRQPTRPQRAPVAPHRLAATAKSVETPIPEDPAVLAAIAAGTKRSLESPTSGSGGVWDERRVLSIERDLERAAASHRLLVKRLDDATLSARIALGVALLALLVAGLAVAL